LSFRDRDIVYGVLIAEANAVAALIPPEGDTVILITNCRRSEKLRAERCRLC
jgi:hypothetical protein